MSLLQQPGGVKHYRKFDYFKLGIWVAVGVTAIVAIFGLNAFIFTVDGRFQPAVCSDPVETEQCCPLTSAQLDTGMNTLYGVFDVVDNYFNNTGGITYAQALALGIWADEPQSAIVVHGPFSQLPNMALVAPGSVMVQGRSDCSSLHTFFDSQIIQAFPGAKRFHSRPVVTTINRESRTAFVNTRANVYNSTDHLVAVENGLAMYKISCNPVAVPAIVWIHFTLDSPVSFS